MSTSNSKQSFDSQQNCELNSVYRILDASANRCREGLRVVEEYVRFHLNNSTLTESLKSLRHELQLTLAGLKLEQHLACRDTSGDVGTQISLETERKRSSLKDLVRANSKRVQESLRVLEEYSKLIDPALAAKLESIRYRYYDLEKVLFEASLETLKSRLNDADLYLLINEADCKLGLEETVLKAAEGGVGLFQLRDKRLNDRALLEQARRLRELTRQTKTLLVINDRPDLAILAEADGIHVGQEELSVQAVRRLVGNQMLIGVSTHSLTQAHQAIQDGADYLGVGPVFTSQTKQFDELAGLEFVRAMASAQENGEITIPWFAIGGITPENREELKRAGAKRVAVSQAVLKSEKPEKVSRDLKNF